MIFFAIALWAMPTNCAEVRAIVAVVGEARATQMARAAGASEEQLAMARQCLRPARDPDPARAGYNAHRD